MWEPGRKHEGEKAVPGPCPIPTTAIAVYWGRMLPFTVEHRQLTMRKAGAFCGEKLLLLRRSQAPNRYSPTDSTFNLRSTFPSLPAVVCVSSFCIAEKTGRYRGPSAGKRCRSTCCAAKRLSFCVAAVYLVSHMLAPRVERFGSHQFGKSVIGIVMIHCARGYELMLYENRRRNRTLIE